MMTTNSRNTILRDAIVTPTVCSLANKYRIDALSSFLSKRFDHTLAALDEGIEPLVEDRLGELVVVAVVGRLGDRSGEASDGVDVDRIERHSDRRSGSNKKLIGWSESAMLSYCMILNHKL